MRVSQLYIPTLREVPADAKLVSHRLLLRGGFIRMVCAGVFSYLPLGLRVLRKIEGIVREEMNRAGAFEVLLPALNPADLWKQTGRWWSFQPPPLKLKDGAGREFLLGPTHEEIMTDLAAQDLRSYRQLPFTLYQIQTKFRDELRPRGGLIRAREFVMKDAYSFDADAESLHTSYMAMYEAYCRIFRRLELPTVICEASAGSMGGTDTKEFMLICEEGEDTLFLCDTCDYTSNAECAESRRAEPAQMGDRFGERDLIETPNARTVEEVCAMLGVTPDQLVKTLLYVADGEYVAALIRGDRELNETKLANYLGATELRMASEEEIEQVTGAPLGFTGPVGLPRSVRIIADHDIALMHDFVVGANQADAHIVGVDVGQDFAVEAYADIRQAMEGDACPRCEEGLLRAARGIELAHVFKLGQKYARDLGCVYSDETGHEQIVTMGCYGVGVSRIMSAVVEHFHDQDGIIWPAAIAPYDAIILLLDSDQELAAIAERACSDLAAAGLEALLDDRNERPGVKFKDADLIGYPVRIVVGRKTKQEGLLEVRRRRDRVEVTATTDQLVETVRKLVEKT
ncbi:MAG: proline--tRNA ligase [Candidatus Zipacnadales bacterium]